MLIHPLLTWSSSGYLSRSLGGTGTGSGFKSLFSRSWGLGLGGEGAEVK